VVGLEPSLLYVSQYAAVRRYLPQPGVFVLPLGVEDLMAGLQAFDTVFSMGVLYHRRSPLEHLSRLWAALRPGGELVLETLVIDGDRDAILVPEGRYAKMRNVWAIPSCLRLETWLLQAGFQDVQVVDISPTTSQEQRRTDWMTFESLADFLNPDDRTQTVEGHPAPVRAVAIAHKPC
jgi:tRNA (mo5U34)-methyltransferase